MKLTCIGMTLALLMITGCVESTPPAATPAVAKLNDLCSSGNVQACTVVAEQEQQERERVSDADHWFNPGSLDPSDFTLTPREPRPMLPMNGSVSPGCYDNNPYTWC